MKTLILQEADLTALYDCLKELRSEITELRRMKEPPEHRYLSRSEVCDLLHISYSTLHRMTRQGEIRCLKNGRRNLFHRAYAFTGIIAASTSDIRNRVRLPFFRHRISPCRVIRCKVE